MEYVRTIPICRLMIGPDECGFDAPGKVRVAVGSRAAWVPCCEMHARIIHATFAAVVGAGELIEPDQAPVPQEPRETFQVSGNESALPEPPAEKPYETDFGTSAHPRLNLGRTLFDRTPHPEPAQASIVFPHQNDGQLRHADGRPVAPDVAALDVSLLKPGQVYCILRDERGNLCGRQFLDSSHGNHAKTVHKIESYQLPMWPERKYACQAEGHREAGCVQTFNDEQELEMHRRSTRIPVQKYLSGGARMTPREALMQS